MYNSIFARVTFAIYCPLGQSLWWSRDFATRWCCSAQTTIFWYTAEVESALCFKKKKNHQNSSTGKSPTRNVMQNNSWLAQNCIWQSSPNKSPAAQRCLQLFSWQMSGLAVVSPSSVLVLALLPLTCLPAGACFPSLPLCCKYSWLLCALLETCPAVV